MKTFHLKLKQRTMEREKLWQRVLELEIFAIANPVVFVTARAKGGAGEGACIYTRIGIVDSATQDIIMMESYL